ncbi:MAG: ABC transporter permease [Lachnospiraceae bacterium]|nr:ABC transporter permease [Lachnospiraceae bacterium]
MAAYFASLNPNALWNAAPGGLAQGLIWGIMALGVYLTFRVLNFADMTCDGSFALGGCTAVMLILGGWSPEAVLLVSFIAGIAAGLATGILHTVLGIPDILAGILTQISLYSINLNIMGKANQAVPVNAVKVHFTSNIQYLGQTIALTLIVDIVIIAVFYWFLGTELGSSIRATGINPHMSRAQGINTNLMKVIALAVSNGLIALSGGILTEYQGFADVKMGQGSIVIGLAAVIIGEVLAEAIVGKRLNFIMRLTFTVVGGVVYYFVYVFVLWLKFPADDMKLLTAIVVAAFLAVPYLQSLRRNSFRGLARRNARLAAQQTSPDKDGKDKEAR